MFYGTKHWTSLECKLYFLETIVFNDIMEMNFTLNKHMHCIIMGIVQRVSVVLKNCSFYQKHYLKEFEEKIHNF